MGAPNTTAKGEKTCSFSGCERQHIARGLCMTHYRQVYRGMQLKPIRSKEATVGIGGVRVSAACFKALSKKGPSPYLAARDILEKWANA